MTKKVKVVHLISGLQVGGAETVLYQLVDSLDRRSFDQTVIYFHSGPFVEKIEELGVPTYQVTGLFFHYDFVFIYRLFTLIKHLQPTCLHTVLWAAGFWGKILGHFYKIPTVHACHNMVEHNGFLRNLFDRWVAKWVDQTVAVSEGVAGSLDAQAPWMKGYPVTVIKNGIDTHQITSWGKREKKTRKVLGFSDKQVIIGAVGRLERSKNFGLLLTSFALLYDNYRNARLIIIGSGSQERFLKKRSSDFGIDDRVTFISGQRAYGYYSLFDCFVSSSLSEGLSIALLEAMSFGVTPIVCSPDQKHEVIKHKQNGLLISSGNAYELARSMAQCIQSKKLRDRLGLAAQGSVENHFKSETMVQKYTDLYKTLAQKSRIPLRN
jgi:glycosyltransferase involved in cell wall biosynthesis